MKPRHIPDRTFPGFTYCGRLISVTTRVIDLERDCIEDAECKSCERSDDRRTREMYQQQKDEHAD
jgi:hypothetical protein